MAPKDPPNLAEVRAREEIREELHKERAHREDNADAQDKRQRAFAISMTLLICLLLPLLGIVVGFTIRIFRWAADW